MSTSDEKDILKQIRIFYFKKYLDGWFVSFEYKMWIIHIQKSFNIVIDTFEECIELLKKITKEMYLEMLPHIEDNFERAKKYTHFRFNEEEILKLV